jgi:hypothetical protein
MQTLAHNTVASARRGILAALACPLIWARHSPRVMVRVSSALQAVALITRHTRIRRIMQPIVTLPLVRHTHIPSAREQQLREELVEGVCIKTRSYSFGCVVRTEAWGIIPIRIFI